MDRKLERWLDFDGGFFIEAGANNGVQQSNTYYLEKMRGWSGLLVEPVPALAAECRKNRNQPVVEAALVSPEQEGCLVELHWAGLMSTLSGALGNAEATAAHVETGRTIQNIREATVFQVRGRRLSALLDEYGFTGERRIDFFSLDVEGAEPSALAGLDLGRHAPRFICVEARDEVAVGKLLETHYELVDELANGGTYRDLLYRLRGMP
jgi:FkbM family methyltransferase